MLYWHCPTIFGILSHKCIWVTNLTFQGHEASSVTWQFDSLYVFSCMCSIRTNTISKWPNVLGSWRPFRVIKGWQFFQRLVGHLPIFCPNSVWNCEFRFSVRNAKFRDFVLFPSKRILFCPYVCVILAGWLAAKDIGHLCLCAVLHWHVNWVNFYSRLCECCCVNCYRFKWTVSKNTPPVTLYMYYETHTQGTQEKSAKNKRAKSKKVQLTANTCTSCQTVTWDYDIDNLYAICHVCGDLLLPVPV